MQIYMSSWQAFRIQSIETISLAYSYLLNVHVYGTLVFVCFCTFVLFYSIELVRKL